MISSPEYQQGHGEHQPQPGPGQIGIVNGKRRPRQEHDSKEFQGRRRASGEACAANSAELGLITFPPGSAERGKFEEVLTGTDTAYGLAKKHRLKTAWGTDVLFSRALAQRQVALLASLVRWYTPAETLKMATGDNAQLIELSGPRTPYAGKLGVVDGGALADLLLEHSQSVCSE